MEETVTMTRTRYKLTIYLVGGTTFSTEITDEGLRNFERIIHNSKTLKKSNYIITFGDAHGVNIRNLNAYEIEEVE